jgi:trk system potassium uptake protein
MHVIISGCGRVGSQLAQHLAYEGHDVVIIDKDPESFSRLGGTFNGITLQGIAFDEELLKEAGIERAEAFAAVTNFDNTNLMAAEIALSVFKVPVVIARLYNPDKRHTYTELGIDFICGTALVAERIKEKLLEGYLISHHERFDLEAKLVEFMASDKVEGRKAGSLNDPENARLLIIFRGNKSLDWNDDTPLQVGDRLVMTLKREGWGKILEFVDRESVL